MRVNTLLSVVLAKSSRWRAVLGLLVASGLTSALMISRPSHAEDEYLRSIRSEGHKLEQLDRRPGTTDDKRGTLPVKDFEAALMLDSPDSYRIYQQLTQEKRQAVFELYLEKHDLKAVRRRIIDLRLGS